MDNHTFTWKSTDNGGFDQHGLVSGNIIVDTFTFDNSRYAPKSINYTIPEFWADDKFTKITLQDEYGGYTELDEEQGYLHIINSEGVEVFEDSVAPSDDKNVLTHFIELGNTESGETEFFVKAGTGWAPWEFYFTIFHKTLDEDGNYFEDISLSQSKDFSLQLAANTEYYYKIYYEDFEWKYQIVNGAAHSNSKMSKAAAKIILKGLEEW